MELCEEVQVEEYAIHVVGSTNFYTHVQFSLLASTWFPRRLGVCLWSALHVLLVLYEALMLLVLYPTGVVLAVLIDAIFVACHFINIAVSLIIVIVVAVAFCLWLVITFQCCTMPGRVPGQGLGQYIFTAGGTLGQHNSQPVVEGGAAAADKPFEDVDMFSSFTLRFVRHVIQVSFPYQRAQLGGLCGETVAWYDTTVILPLVLYKTLMLLVIFPTGFVLAVLIDSMIVACQFICIAATLIIVIGVDVAFWLWLVINFQCCTMPGRAPGQGLGRYIFTAGGTLGRRNPQPAPVVEGGAAAADIPFEFNVLECQQLLTKSSTEAPMPEVVLGGTARISADYGFPTAMVFNTPQWSDSNGIKENIHQSPIEALTH